MIPLSFHKRCGFYPWLFTESPASDIISVLSPKTGRTAWIMEKEASWRNRDHFLSLSSLYHKTSYDSTVFFHKNRPDFLCKTNNSLLLSAVLLLAPSVFGYIVYNYVLKLCIKSKKTFYFHIVIDSMTSDVLR